MSLPYPPQTILSTVGNPGPQSATNPSEGTEFGQQAQITIGTISADAATIYADTTLDVNVTTSYTVRNKFESDKHVYMMPISSPTGFNPNSSQGQGASPGGTIQNNPVGQAAAFVQLASPTLLWIADWTVSKWGIQPDIPDPNNLTDLNWVLLDEQYETGTIVVAADGKTPLYRISGTFVFGHLSPSSQVLNNIAFGRPPFLFDVIYRSMPTNKQQKRIIDFDVQSSTVLSTVGALPAGLAGTFGG